MDSSSAIKAEASAKDWSVLDEFDQHWNSESPMVMPGLSEAILETDKFLSSIGIADDDADDDVATSKPLLQQDLLLAAKRMEVDADPFGGGGFMSTPVMSPVSESVTNELPQLNLNISGCVDMFAAAAAAAEMLDDQTGGFGQQRCSQHLMETSSSASSCSSCPNSSGSSSSGYLSSGSNNFSPPGGSTWKGGGGGRHFSAGPSALDPIPEHEVTEPPRTFQPLIPPSIVPRRPPISASYNISFPATLQPRDRYDIWRNAAQPPTASVSGGLPVAAAAASLASLQRLIEGRKATGDSTLTSSASKSNKRSRSNTPARHCHSEDQGDTGVSSRQRRKSNAGTGTNAKDLLQQGKKFEDCSSGSESHSLTATSSTSSRVKLTKRRSASEAHVLDAKSTTGFAVESGKRKDPLKMGLDALQRVLPHVGSPEEEKMSQASVLYESAKYLKNAKKNQLKATEEIAALKEEVDRLNAEIEAFQSQLPENGCGPLKVGQEAMMTSRTSLPTMFHDHVVERTLEDWRYWVFTSIMGHFVHSFSHEVSTDSLDDLTDSSMEWVTQAMSLQQLRKDAFRKLAKISAKTSIVDEPSKLPQEALGFVQKTRWDSCSFSDAKVDGGVG